MELLNELTTNSYTKKGKSYFSKFHPELEGKEAYEAFLQFLGKSLERTSDLDDCNNGVKSSFFTLGVTRLALEDKNYDIHKMSKILRSLISNPNPSLDWNFNGIESVDELYRMVVGDIKKDSDIASLPTVTMAEDGKSIHIGRYEIVNTFTYDTIKKVAKLEGVDNPICYVSNVKNFYTDERHTAARAKYSCIRDDYKTVDKKVGRNYPLDDYGLSFIMISVSHDGELEVCSRWNNGAKTSVIQKSPYRDEAKKNFDNWLLNHQIASKYMSDEEVKSQILGGQYDPKDIFKPFDDETYNFRMGNLDNLTAWAKDLERQRKLYGKGNIEDYPELAKYYDERGEYMDNIYRNNGKLPQISESDILYMVKKAINEVLKRKK